MKCSVLALLATAGCFVQSPVVRFGGGKSPQEAQHAQVERLTPPALVADGEWGGEVRKVRIRVWADDDYRAQNVHWERTFGEELEYANEVLGATFGIELEAEYRTWNYQSSGSTLEEKLVELQRVDPGSDVFAVVGLTSALGLVSATFDQLGLASLPGRHMMVRGYADVERIAFDRAFAKVPKDERDALYVGRRRHKTTAIFLHELGHNLGAPHVQADNALMNPMYSDHSSAFDGESKELMLSTIDMRLGRLHHEPAKAAALPVHGATAAQTEGTARPGHPVLVIAVTKAGAMLFGGQPIDDDTLDGLLASSFSDDTETEVLVKMEVGAPKAVATKISDRAKGRFLTHISITNE